MNEDRCPHCQTPYTEDRDDNESPWCGCEGSVIARLRDALRQYANRSNWNATERGFFNQFCEVGDGWVLAERALLDS